MTGDALTNLRRMVENQEGHLRGLSTSVRDYVGLREEDLRPGDRGIIRGWAEQIEAIALLLNEAANKPDGPDKPLLKRIGVVAGAILGSAALVFGVANDAMDLNDRFNVPEQIQPQIDVVEAGFTSIQFEIEVGGTQSDPTEREALGQVVAVPPGAVVEEIEHELERLLGDAVAGATGSSGYDRPWALAERQKNGRFKVHLNDHDDQRLVSVMLESEYPLVDRSMAYLVEEWVSKTVESLQSSMAEDQAVQQEIDRQRGK